MKVKKVLTFSEAYSLFNNGKHLYCEVASSAPKNSNWRIVGVKFKDDSGTDVYLISTAANSETSEYAKLSHFKKLAREFATSGAYKQFKSNSYKFNDKALEEGYLVLTQNMLDENNGKFKFLDLNFYTLDDVEFINDTPVKLNG